MANKLMKSYSNKMYTGSWMAVINKTYNWVAFSLTIATRKNASMGKTISKINFNFQNYLFTIIFTFCLTLKLLRRSNNEILRKLNGNMCLTPLTYYLNLILIFFEIICIKPTTCIPVLRKALQVGVSIPYFTFVGLYLKHLNCFKSWVV